METTVTGPDGAQRLRPSLPAHAVKTFLMSSERHVVTCAEYGCANYLQGWVTVVPEGPQADLARTLRGRYAFTEARQPGGLVEFTFPPGQECWLEHTLPWEGREHFIVRGGDWRGNPRGERQEFTRPDDWVDSFANHQIRLADRMERG